jgi:hypothetical protein
MPMTTEYQSIEAIKKANADAGFNFFDKHTMQFFNSRIHGTVYNGRFFITSEQDNHGAWNSERRYTVRECVDGRINTVSAFGEFETARQAAAFARDVHNYHKALM